MAILAPLRWLWAHLVATLELPPDDRRDEAGRGDQCGSGGRRRMRRSVAASTAWRE
jgi:hypothetical protein